MLSTAELRQARAVVACLVLAALAGLWFLASGKFTPTILALFYLFWIAPVAESFTLYPLVLRRIAIGCTLGSTAFVAVHLVWRWFSPADEEYLKTWYATMVLPLGAGLFLLLVPFILSRSADDFAIWRPWRRRRAVALFWAILLIAWAVMVFGFFGAEFAPPAMVEPLRGLFLPAALVLGSVLYFETTLVEWLAKR